MDGTRWAHKWSHAEPAAAHGACLSHPTRATHTSRDYRHGVLAPPVLRGQRLGARHGCFQSATGSTQGQVLHCMIRLRTLQRHLLSRDATTHMLRRCVKLLRAVRNAGWAERNSIARWWQFPQACGASTAHTPVQASMVVNAHVIMRDTPSDMGSDHLSTLRQTSPPDRVVPSCQSSIIYRTQHTLRHLVATGTTPTSKLAAPAASGTKT